MEDFKKYPFAVIAENYFSMHAQNFKLLGSEMPEGMKVIGGVGNGVFEIVKDLVGYTELFFIRADNQELYRALFKKVRDILDVQRI